MPKQTVTLQIPQDLYVRIRQRAERSRRSVEDEFVDVLASAVTDAGELPAALAEAIAPLERLDDAALWEAARGTLPGDVSEELQSLHLKQQRLTDADRERSEELCFQYDRVMLIRAHAAALLKQRGHDVANLQGSP